MSDPRLNPVRLSAYLIGEVGAGIGLLFRVERAARAFSKDSGPKMAGGWYIGSKPTKEGSYHNNDDVVELALYLAQWRGNKRFDTAAKLAQWLAASHAGDVSYLGEQVKATADRIRNILIPGASEVQVAQGLELATYLKDWLGTECNHSFRVAHRDVSFELLSCIRCGYDIPAAGFPLARCDVCSTPIPANEVGRPHQTCSDLCRKRKSRHKTSPSVGTL